MCLLIQVEVLLFSDHTCRRKLVALKAEVAGLLLFLTAAADPPGPASFLALATSAI